MVQCHIILLPINSHWQDYAQGKPLWVELCPLCCVNVRTLLANLPDWLKAAPMRENLLASWRQSGQKQDPCPSLLNHNANTSGFCRLVVISPTVSERFRFRRNHMGQHALRCGNSISSEKVKNAQA